MENLGKSSCDSNFKNRNILFLAIEENQDQNLRGKVIEKRWVETDNSFSFQIKKY